MPASDREPTERMLAPVRLDPAVRAAIGDRLEAAVLARSRARAWRRGAAGLAVVGALGALLILMRTGPTPTAPAPAVRMRTGPGEFQLLPVGDRAVAFVDQNSDVEVVPGPAIAVRLHRGGARFVVSRDPGRASFVVHTAEAEVAVLGTEFDVSAGSDGTEVKVVRGEVEVRNALGRRGLWAGEGARVQPGGAPRVVLPVRGLVTEEGPAEVRPARR